MTETDNLEKRIKGVFERNADLLVRPDKEKLIAAYEDVIKDAYQSKGLKVEGEGISDKEALKVMRELGRVLHLKELNIGVDDPEVYKTLLKKISDGDAESYVQQMLGEQLYATVEGALKSGNATEAEVKRAVEERFRDYLKEKRNRAENSNIKINPSDWILSYQKGVAAEFGKRIGTDKSVRYEKIPIDSIPVYAERAKKQAEQYANLLLNK